MNEERVHIFRRMPASYWRKITVVDSMDEADQYWRDHIQGRGLTGWTEFVKESEVDKFLAK